MIRLQMPRLQMHPIPAAATLACALLLPLSARATPQKAVVVQNPWIRATPPGATTGVLYLTLTSQSGDKLVGVSTPAAASAGVHDMRMSGTVMQMRPVEGGLVLPPGKPVSLSPHGLHVMLEGLHARLAQGATVPVHLTFEKAAPLDIVVPVLPIGASGPDKAAPSMPGMQMPN